LLDGLALACPAGGGSPCTTATPGCPGYQHGLPSYAIAGAAGGGIYLVRISQETLFNQPSGAISPGIAKTIGIQQYNDVLQATARYYASTGERIFGNLFITRAEMEKVPTGRGFSSAAVMTCQSHCFILWKISVRRCGS